MTRTVLAIAATAFAATTLLASGAQACISCEYVPEVTRAHSKSFTTRSYEKKRLYIAKKDLGVRLPKARLAKTDLVAKKAEAARKVEAAKSEPVTEKVETAETETTSEPETLSAASSPETGTTTPVEETKVPAGETKVAGDVVCKKFFPAVGTTLTVPCE